MAGQGKSLKDTILPSAISAGTGLIGSALGGVFAARQNKKMRDYDWKKFQAQNQFAHDEAALARQFEEDMYTKYMDYDSQVEQALKAGVNPNAIIGNAGSSEGGFSAAAGSPGTGGVPSQFPEQFMDAESLSKIALTSKQLAMLDSEKKNLDADTDNKEANTGKTYVEARKIIEETKGIIYNNEQILPKQREQLQAIIDKTLADKRLTDEEAAKVKQETDNLIKQYDILVQQEEQAKEIVKLYKEQQKTEKSKQANLASSTAVNYETVNKIVTEEEYNKANTNLTNAEIKKQELFNEYEANLQEIGESTSYKENTVSKILTKTGLIHARNKKDKARDEKAAEDAHKVAVKMASNRQYNNPKSKKK